MTTVAQIKTITRVLLERHSDLALFGRALIVKPVHHVWRGLAFQHTLSRHAAYVAPFATFLCEPDNLISTHVSASLGDAKSIWRSDDPNTPVALADDLERTVLPLLRSFDTLEGFFAHAPPPTFSVTRRAHPWLDVLLHTALGDFDAVCKAFVTIESTSSGKSLVPAKEYRFLSQVLLPLVDAKDYQGVASLLHEREAGNVRKLKLQKIWERSPFPIEDEARFPRRARKDRAETQAGTLQTIQLAKQAAAERLQASFDPLLKRNDGLSLFLGKAVAIGPVRHLLRFIFARHDIQSNDIFLSFGVAPMFDPSEGLSLAFAASLHPADRKAFNLSDPDIGTAMAQIIEERALPLLAPVLSFDDFVRFTALPEIRSPVHRSPGHSAALHAALDQLQEAHDALDAYAEMLDGLDSSFRTKSAKALLDLLRPRVASCDRPAIARLLHRWEKHHARSLGLEPKWEKTPFPVETG